MKVIFSLKERLHGRRNIFRFLHLSLYYIIIFYTNYIICRDLVIWAALSSFLPFFNLISLLLKEDIVYLRKVFRRKLFYQLHLYHVLALYEHFPTLGHHFQGHLILGSLCLIFKDQFGGIGLI